MKRNKRQYRVPRISHNYKLINFFKDYTSILALLIPIIPSVLYAGIASYQYGQCYFYNISLQSYLGISYANIIVQAILIIGVGIGLLSLNTLGYIVHLKNGFLAIFLTVMFPVFLCFLTIVTAQISDPHAMLIMLRFFFNVTAYSFIPGVIIALLDKKTFRKTNKNLLIDLWRNNKLFKEILFVAPILIIIFSICFSTGYANRFETTSLNFTIIKNKEYAIIYEGNDYYQLASTLQKKKTSKIQVLLDIQMRVEKNNILIYPKDSDSFKLMISNN